MNVNLHYYRSIKSKNRDEGGIQMEVGYVAVETFHTTEKYKEWSKLYHVRDVVSLDCALCPGILNNSSIQEDFKYLPGYSSYEDVLNNLYLLLSIVSCEKDTQILAVIREPDEDSTNLLTDERFKFYGYDLLEDFTRISAITNCGGFDKAFSPKDISEYGLIKEFDKAKQIQLLLEKEYPDESHASCTLWAIWQME